MMYSLYKVVFNLIALIAIWVLLPIIDSIFNLTLYIISRWIIRPRTLVDWFESVRQSKNSDNWKYKQLAKVYEWKADPVFGLLNWSYRSVWVAALFRFRGDCDDWANIISWLLPGGKKYSILPYHPKRWWQMHVVYVKDNVTYSSGNRHPYKLDEYLENHYRGVDYTVRRIW